MNYTVLDAETTTYNKGHPFDPRNKLISYAYSHPNSTPCFKYHTDPDFPTHLGGELNPNYVLVGFNFKFDCHYLFPVYVNNPIWDCQLAEFVYGGQTDGYISLNECLVRYGLETKTDLVAQMWEAGYQTDEIPIDILKEYNCWDVTQTEKLFHVQQLLLSEDQKRLVYALGEDLKVLAHTERAGFLFDVDGAKNALAKYEAEVATMEEQLRCFLPPITHGTFNWDSGDHLSCLLYGGTIEFTYAEEEVSVYKSGTKKGETYTKRKWFTESVFFQQRFRPLEGSEVKKTQDNGIDKPHYYQVDEPTLKQLTSRKKEDKRLLDLLQSRSAKQKVAEMFQSIFDKFEEKQWEGNLIHTNYNQAVVRTGRLSSSSPNMQNQPPELDEFLVSRYD